MEKGFLTYNQQMKYLRDNKKINCQGSDGKTILCRAGYFNLVNGYKGPFVNGMDVQGNHTYLPNIGIYHLNDVKKFDDELRILLLKYITKTEEEVRAFAAYKFDEINQKGTIPWYQIDAFDTTSDIQKVIGFISKAYSEISRSKLEYVNFYMNNHRFIPTWVLTKVINFSTFIDFLEYSKTDVKRAICNLYSIIDSEKYADFKLLIGSLHWLRKVRNACAHNERVYTIRRNTGRIHGIYFSLLPKSYVKEKEQKLLDLFIYFKYFLDSQDYNEMLTTVKKMLVELSNSIPDIAFSNVRASMGIKDIKHLDILLENNKKIEYNKF